MTADISAAPSGARNATLADLAALLRDEQARKVDVVAPAAAIHAHGGQLVVEDAAPVLGPEGVTMTTGVYTPTDVCDSGIADKLGIPAAYLRRMREHKPGLYDANVNGWLEGDDRRFLLRCLRGDSGGGAARAFLSDGYKIIDLSRSWDYPDGWAGVAAFALVKQAGERALIFGSRDNPAAACDPLPPEQWHPVEGGTMGGTVSWTQGDGPLVPFVDGFRRELAGLGHPPGVVHLHVKLMGQVDRWLSAAGLGAGDLSLAVARQFLADRRARGLRRVPTLAGLAPLLGYLRGEGVLPPEPPAAVTGTDVLLARYRGYLAGDRGLAPTTVGRYERFARRFLAGRASRAGGGTGAEGLASGEINDYLLAAASRLTTVDSVKREAADLRSLLRFLYLTGMVDTDLGAAMPLAGGARGCPRPWAGRRWRRCWAAVTAQRRAGGGIGLSWRCWPGWVFAAARSLPSSSPTSTGARGRSWCAVRGAAGTGFRCQPRWVRRWWPTWPAAARHAHAGRCSSP